MQGSIRAHVPMASGGPTSVAVPSTKMFAAQIASSNPPAHIETQADPCPRTVQLRTSIAFSGQLFRKRSSRDLPRFSFRMFCKVAPPPAKLVAPQLRLQNLRLKKGRSSVWEIESAAPTGLVR